MEPSTAAVFAAEMTIARAASLPTIEPPDLLLVASNQSGSNTYSGRKQWENQAVEAHCAGGRLAEAGVSSPMIDHHLGCMMVCRLGLSGYGAPSSCKSWWW